MKNIKRRVGLVALLTVPILVAAGCGGGSASSPPASAAGASAGGAITAASSSLGKILVGGNGMTLYMFARDQGDKSACSGACAKYWPPYTGTPKAGNGLQASLLGSTVRADGTKQVTYDGHPLYTYSGDSAPGATGGQGLSTFGALWWVVAPDGKVVMTSAQQGSSGGSYGY